MNTDYQLLTILAPGIIRSNEGIFIMFLSATIRVYP